MGRLIDLTGDRYGRLTVIKRAKRDLYCCQVCGMTQDESGEALSVHHIDYDKRNPAPENLIALCKSCHMQTNGNRKYWYSKLRRDQ